MGSMMRWFIADLRTGRQVLDIKVRPSSRWSRVLNAPEELTAELDMQDPATIALKPAQTMAPGRTVLACAVGDTILAAGPIWAHDYERGAKTLRLTARGLWSYFDHRYLLPVVAATAPTGTFILPDPSAAGKTKVNPTFGTYLSNLEYGTIAKRWVQQARAWTGGNVPVVFEADRSGTRERNHDGVDFKNIGTLLSQLTEIEHGPDIRFKPRFTADRLGLEWVMQTGTDASPLLADDAGHAWTVAMPGSPVSNFKVKVDGTRLASIAWATAGRTVDSVLVSRATDTTLLDLGYPLLETLDTSHSTVSIQSTLDGYTAEATTVGRATPGSWDFTVEAARQPFLGSYWEGDWCEVTIPPYDPVKGVGDPYLFEGARRSRRRITSMSGRADGLTADITTQEAIDG